MFSVLDEDDPRATDDSGHRDEMYTADSSHTHNHGFLQMRLGASKYFEGLKCIQSQIHTHTHNHGLLGHGVVLKLFQDHITTLTCNKSSNAFRCFKVLRRSQTHSKLNTHTQSWLPSNAFGCFKVLRSTQTHSKNITTYIHRYLLAVTLLMLSLWKTLVYNSPFI